MMKEVLVTVLVMVGLIVGASMNQGTVEPMVVTDAVQKDVVVIEKEVSVALAAFSEYKEYSVELEVSAADVVERYAGQGEVYLGDGLYITMQADGSFELERGYTLSYGQIGSKDITISTPVEYGHSESVIHNITFQLQHTEAEHRAHMRAQWEEESKARLAALEVK